MLNQAAIAQHVGAMVGLSKDHGSSARYTATRCGSWWRWILHIRQMPWHVCSQCEWVRYVAVKTLGMLYSAALVCTKLQPRQVYYLPHVAPPRHLRS